MGVGAKRGVGNKTKWEEKEKRREEKRRAMRRLGR
jgi:hypothetical protein